MKFSIHIVSSAHRSALFCLYLACLLRMEFDLVSGMRVEELKSYLRLRGLKLSGRKAEIVARVFAASENNIRLIKTAAEVEVELCKEYQNKLNHGGISVPDPKDLKQGWLTEADGILLWPMITYPDICDYLKFHPSELSSSDLSEYKNSKGYSYFKRGWIAQIMYHEIDQSSLFCFVKTDCRASERLRDPPHTLWACISKKDGVIKSAHCDCMAGMSGTCLHVAAMFYRIEAAVRLGLTNPSCTGKSNEWLPNRTEVVPVKVKDLKLQRDDFGKRGKKVRKLVSTPKKKYNPFCAIKDFKPLQLTDIATALEDVIPDSILSTAVPKPKVYFVREMISNNDPQPEDLESMDDVMLMSDSSEAFFSNISAVFNDDKINGIEVCTRGQSNNQSWFTYRKGVITASKGHEICTKMRKIRKGQCEIDLWQLFQKVSGLTFVNPNIPALKYGRAMEPIAANECYNLLSVSHKNLKILECGLFLDRRDPYIGASPDGLLVCDCCPKACLEIKCPFSINHTSPNSPDITLPYLKSIDGEMKLSSTHKYYTQCQMQVTGCSHCYFCVWTQHGFVLNKISFDPAFWNDIKGLFFEFYKLYVASLY